MAASSDNMMMVTGNLTADPVLRYTPQGTPVATFRVARTKRKPDPNNRGQFIDGETLFINVVAWRNFAENFVESQGLGKGATVHVVGELRIREIEPNEKYPNPRTVVEIDADEVSVTLRNQTVTLSKVRRNTGDAALAAAADAAVADVAAREGSAAPAPTAPAQQAPTQQAPAAQTAPAGAAVSTFDEPPF